MNREMYLKIGRAGTIILSFIFLFFIVKYTFIYVYPFFIALMIAVILNPLVTYLETSWKWKRTMATLFIMCSFFIILFTVSFFIVKHLLRESVTLVETLPEKINQLKQFFAHIGQTLLLPIYEKIQSNIPSLPRVDQLSILLYIETFIDDLGQSSLSLLSTFVGTASDVLSSITHMLTIFVFIVIASFIMTKDFEKLTSIVQSFIPKKALTKLGQIKQLLKKSVFGLMKAQIFITFISTTIVFIGFIIFQVNNMFMTTLIIFFIDFIPYVGIGAVFIPWILYNFFTGKFVFTVQLSLLYIIVIIVRQVVEPKILASSIGIHPLVTLFILFVGIQSLGIIGVFLTPVVFVLFSAVYHARIFHILWEYVKNG